MNTKKLFIIAAFLLVLVSGTLVIYNFFLKNSGSSPSPAPRENKSSKVAAISQEQVLAPVIDGAENKIKYYSAKNGYVFRSAFDGSGLETISDTNLDGLTKVSWSPDVTKVLTFFGKLVPPKQFSYDYKIKKAREFGPNIKWVAWSPDSQKIAYQFQTPDASSNNISVADPDGTNWRNVLQTRLQDLVVEWPTPDKLYIRSKPSGQELGFLFSIELSSGNLNKIFSDTYGFSLKWSPDGQKIIYQTTEQKGKSLKLFLANSDGSQPQPLPFATLAEKCAWSSDGANIFCAVPQNASENAAWPDDYFAGRLSIKDDVYLFDIKSQEKIKIISSSDDFSFDAIEPVVSPAKDYIFFINRKNGLLYSVKIDLK